MPTIKKGKINPFQKNKLLSDFSTFGIGGPARYFTSIRSKQEAIDLLSYCSQNQLPFHILGKGSNSLFSDQGFDGLVILNKIQDLSVENTRVFAGGGVSFSLLGTKTANRGLGGLEFAAAIPASVGGAVFMNAGAQVDGHLAQVSDVISQVEFVDQDGKCRLFEKEELSFSYRSSMFSQMKGVIVSARFELKVDESASQRLKNHVQYRMQTQPYGEKSCGCIFKNPTGKSAGALIEEAGLKGLKEGGAIVSLLHANFIINQKDARAKDVLLLAKKVQQKVKQKSGIELEFELRCISKL